MNPRTPALALLGDALLVGCSDAVDTTDQATPSATAEAPASGQEAPAGAPGQEAPDGRAPGTSGVIAAISEGLLQVQGQDSQTAVRFSDDTAITRTTTLDVADVSVGSCVFGFTSDGVVANLTVSEPADGECGLGGIAGGPGGGGGEPPSGDRPTDMPEAPGEIPSDLPDDFPSGGSGGMEMGEPVSGAVGSISWNVITLDDGTQITLADGAVISGTVAATVDDLAVGLCATAQGESDSAGGMDATTLLVTDPDEDGSCTAGLPGMGGRGGRR